MAVAVLASCVCPRGERELPEFRAEVLAHMARLQDAWKDWLFLLRASDVVEGVFQVDDPKEIQGQPEKHLNARVESPRVLLGRPQAGARTFIVFNTTIRRWGYWPVYTRQLGLANGQRCVVFLHGYGKHVVCSAEGKILPITRVSEFAPRWSQLESFLYLAKLDPVQVAHLVARPDSRVEDVVKKLQVATGNREAVQSCYDELRSIGANSLPGILHAMLEALLRPDSNHVLAIDGVICRPSGMSPGYPSLRAHDVFDLLSLSALWDVVGGFPPEEDYDYEARWRLVRVIAMNLLANERLVGATSPGRE